jgi:myo-inositol-1(or 4)-monophosphatase
LNKTTAARTFICSSPQCGILCKPHQKKITMTDFWIQILDLAQQTTATVGAQLLREFGAAQGVEKSDGSLVTQSDRSADDAIRAAIQAVFPTHGLLTEETEHLFPENDWCWIVDPLDGTTNFARGLPLWGISLALLYKGVPVFGYVAMPPLNQNYYGYWAGDTGLEMPSGAFRDGQRLQTSQDDPGGNHFFNICARSTGILQQKVPGKVRMWGSSTYSLLVVAAGSALGAVEATPKIWDIAAVWPIVQAAGGAWSALNGDRLFPLSVGQDYGTKPYPTLVVAREALLPVFGPLVAEIGRR